LMWEVWPMHNCRRISGILGQVANLVYIKINFDVHLNSQAMNRFPT